MSTPTRRRFTTPGGIQALALGLALATALPLAGALPPASAAASSAPAETPQTFTWRELEDAGKPVALNDQGQMVLGSGTDRAVYAADGHTVVMRPRDPAAILTDLNDTGSALGTLDQERSAPADAPGCTVGSDVKPNKHVALFDSRGAARSSPANSGRATPAA